MYFLQELLPTKQEGDSKVSQVKSLADKTLSQTAAPGQQQIKRELESLNFDWQKYASDLKETESGLQGALEGWNEYDSLYESLSKWLSDMEAQVRDYELKSSLPDKQAQVTKYKVSQVCFKHKDPLVAGSSPAAATLCP